ncbi:MAG: hypothetical protein WCI29_13805 [Actinomycetes bacterium]
MADVEPKALKLTRRDWWQIIALIGGAAACLYVILSVGTASGWSGPFFALCLLCGVFIGKIVRRARVRAETELAGEPGEPGPP